MQYRRLGSTGLKVSELALGTMQWGWTADEKSATAVMDAYVEAGGNLIDTADIYSVWAEGNEENMNGLAVARGLRKLVGGSSQVPFTSSGWGTGIVQLRGGNAIDIQGASGELEYDLTNEEKPGGVELLRGNVNKTLTICPNFVCP